MSPAISPEEKRRLDALERYHALDTPSEPALDRITRLAARLFRAPISLITLLDQRRQWVKSSFGLDCREIAREHSFCAHAIQSAEVTVIPDALADDRFRQDPLVDSPQRVRFYAGAPLRTPDGFSLGMLCILDRVPRPPLSPEQRELLSDLAATVIDELELRRSAVLAARATLQNEGQLAALSEALRFSEKSLRSALDALPVAVWIADARGQLLLSNRAAREMWGRAHYVSLERYGDFTAWRPTTGRRLDPAEWGMARALRGEITRQEEIEIESFDGTRKVILNSAVPIWDQSGNVVGGVSVDEDITNRKAYERELLRREKQLHILTRVSRQINQVLEIKTVLRSLVESALQLVNASAGSAGLLENGRLVFREYLHRGQTRPILWDLGRGEGAPGWVLETKQTYISNDAEHDPHVIPALWRPIRFKKLIDVPICDRNGTIIGCFEIHDPEDDRPFDERDAEMLTGLAAAAAIAIENSRMIEDQRAAEEARRQSEERYRALVEASPEGIALHSEGKLLYMNPAALRIVGAARLEDVVGLDAIDFVDPAARPLALERIRMLTEKGGEAPLATETFRRLDGTPIPVEVVSIGFTYRGKPTVQAVFRDISERLRNAEALGASEAQFRAVFDGAVDSMFILDDDWRYIDCNPAGVRLIGRPREEIIGQKFGSLSDPGHGEELLASVRESAVKPPHSSHVQFVLRDKRVREIDYTVRTDFLPGRHLLIGRDVTERMRLEAQLRQAQKMEAVGRLAGGVAHDFNNLLTVISGYSQIALTQLSELDPLRASILEISRAGERAAALTRQLLAFSRKQVLKPEIVDLNTVISDTEKMLRRLIGEDIELVTKLDPVLARIKVDAGQIEQVIMNLAVNARDAMPDGGRLLIETAEVDFESAVELSRLDLPLGSYVVLAVSDTGAGMDAGTLSHIFEPFFTTKGQGKGTGLGLSTVYGIVKQSGGDIWVYSEPGHGTTFKVYLPAISDRALSPAPEPPAAVQHGTETVLVVEDEAGVRDLIAQILKASGYRVLAAANGGEALLTCERFSGPIDLLVTDIIMPGMSGRELAERLASVRPDLRVLHISGYMDNWVLKENMAFIQKPFTPESLTRKVREVLSTPRGGGS